MVGSDEEAGWETPLSTACQGAEFDVIIEEEVQQAPMQMSNAISEDHDNRQRPMKEFTHCLVPKNVNLVEEFSKANHEAPPTTMMILAIQIWVSTRSQPEFAQRKR